MAKTMDENGVAWCRENISLILDFMEAEAAKRKLLFVRSAAKVLIRIALWRATK
jgi:hypothetical protein